MNKVSYAKQGLFFCLIVSLTLLISSCSKDENPSYSIGTGSVTGSYQDVGIAIARIVNKDQIINGFQLEDKISSGSASNINAIATGEAQFGIAQADDQYLAAKGLGEWKDKGPQRDLRAIFSIYVESITLVAGGDTDIRSVNDLKGKIVDIGIPGSGTRRNAIDALRTAGIDWEKDIQVREESLDDRLTKFMHGELDAFFFTVGHPNKEIKFATFSVRGVRLIPLANIDRLISASPYYFETLIPVSIYPMAGNEIDIETIGMNATLLTSAKVSEDIVYAVTKAAFENLESLADFDALRDDKFLEGLMAPIHPGALKYYREVGLQIP